MLLACPVGSDRTLVIAPMAGAIHGGEHQLFHLGGLAPGEQAFFPEKLQHLQHMGRATDLMQQMLGVRESAPVFIIEQQMLPERGGCDPAGACQHRPQAALLALTEAPEGTEKLVGLGRAHYGFPRALAKCSSLWRT